MNLEKTSHGYEVKTPQITVFFGGVHSQIKEISPLYPDFQLVRVKQIHSDAVVETNNHLQDYQILADAHFSKYTNLALCIITADCVPVFFFDPTSGLIAGVHAGWRGVAAKIIPKTLQKLIQVGARSEHLQTFIGPHIQKKSFEVGFDVRDQILASLGPLSSTDRITYSETTEKEKALVDLNQVVLSQLQSEHINMENVFNLHIDTFTDSDFHSYRRDKEKAGRQISFICRTR